MDRAPGQVRVGARDKLLLALGLLGVLAVLGAAGRGVEPPQVARSVLVVAALVTAGWVWWRRRGGAGAKGRFRLPERLQVHARAALSPRCGVALVEVEGERFVVVHGDGFATLRRAGRTARSGLTGQGRRLRAVRGGARTPGEETP